jgi:hypothetical protein
MQFVEKVKTKMLKVEVWWVVSSQVLALRLALLHLLVELSLLSLTMKEPLTMMVWEMLPVEAAAAVTLAKRIVMIVSSVWRPPSCCSYSCYHCCHHWVEVVLTVEVWRVSQ